MKKIILLIFSLCITVMLHAITINTTAGGLSTAITTAGGDLSTLTSLTVTGVIDARDFVTMRDNMPVLSSVDLSEVTIAAYDTYPANEIPSSAFYDCYKFKSIILPSSSTSIGNSAFSFCTSLTSFVIPTSVVFIGSEAFHTCLRLTSITLPSSLTSIGSFAFSRCKALTSINLPSSVSNIGILAFYYCEGLTSISIPSSLTTIESCVFQSCTGLTSITIPNSVTTIELDAFDNTALTSINIPSSVTTIRTSSFANGCSVLLDADVNNQNYSTVDGVLFNKNKTILIQCPTSKTGNYIIPSSVTSIEKYAFCKCSNLTSITIPSLVTSIKSGTFNGCSSLTSITIPSSVSSIGTFAFAGCGSLDSITIPSSVTSIQDYTFSNCSSLTSITIPSSVTSIREYAFWDCAGLTSIYAYRSTPVNLIYSDFVFKDINKTTCTLHVPANSVDLYKAANQWKDFVNIVGMEESGISTETVDMFSIYPNPATDGFYVNGLNAICTLTIVDLNGKTLLTQQVTANNYISIGSLAKGLYVVKISTEAGMIEKKLIKE